MQTPTELASLPATDGHIERARAAVRGNTLKEQRLESLLASNPTRGQMVDFLETLNADKAAEQLENRIAIICKAAGIAEPTGADRLMAMQIGLLQEQNMLLQTGMTRTFNQMRADAKADQANATFTGLVGSALLGLLLVK